jgi:uncharacterized membrane-anchored protein
MSTSAARKTGGVQFVLTALLLLVVLIATASVLLPATVGRVVADLWLGVMGAISRLLGG